MGRTRLPAIGLCVFAAILGSAAPSARAQGEDAAAPGAVENVCSRPQPNPHAAACRKWAAMLGRWTSRKYGGELETTLAPDGTIDGRITGLNERMRNNGFLPGMHVLRGFKPSFATGTWLYMARNGEYFVAVQPGRKPGEPFGTAAWNKVGVIYIAKAKPDQFALHPTLEERLSNYDPWVRVSEGAAAQ